MGEISIKPEVIFHIGNFPITNSQLTGFIVVILFIFLARFYYQSLKAQVGKRPHLFYILHYINYSLYNLIEKIFGKERAEKFFYLIAGFFVYIILQNWFGLLPGVGSIVVEIYEHGKKLHVPLFRGANADINSTLALALVSVGMTQYYGIKYLGLKGYLSKFINFSNPVNFFTGILEIISEASKVISFAFRLFGNIFAGEVLLIIVAFLVPILASFPFLLLEIFVGFVQALVFAVLTAVFLSIAVEKHH